MSVALRRVVLLACCLTDGLRNNSFRTQIKALTAHIEEAWAPWTIAEAVTELEHLYVPVPPTGNTALYDALYTFFELLRGVPHAVEKMGPLYDPIDIAKPNSMGGLVLLDRVLQTFFCVLCVCALS
jgi:hypothetical protein